ncbi:MAG TPA: hypothetical protein VI875_02445 [Candidatus Norongarragalinales archaeon]|nr:hypothetical protein [Candidatus Norongarragalinales archaeon]
MRFGQLASIASVLVIFAAVAYYANQDLESALNQAKPWMNPVVSKNEVAALDWVKANTAERTIFASDIFGGELLMSVLREGTEGGDWAIVPNVVQRMHDMQYDFYEAKSSKQAWGIALKYNAEYAWVPDRALFPGFAWKGVDYTVFEDARYFEKVFDNGHRIYKVKK